MSDEPRTRSAAPIGLRGVSKTYGGVRAVDDLTLDVRSGRITAFLGPNGAGKTTTMRVLLGLTDADSGEALIHGMAYRELACPLAVVGAVVDPGFHPRRSAREHLRVVALQAGVDAHRVGEVLGMLGLTTAAGRRVGGFSLGMRQRLALATAMIARPSVLVLDEPFNGLDPGGLIFLRDFLRDFADGGGTVLLSSHLLAQTTSLADDVIILDRGRLLRVGPVASLTVGGERVRVTSADPTRLARALDRVGASVDGPHGGTLVVSGADPETVGRAASRAGVVITELHTVREDLETLFRRTVELSTAGDRS